MELIVGGRRTGRTTLLIQRCAEAEKRGEISYIVCQSHQQAYAIATKAKEMGLMIGFPITYHEFLGKTYYGRNIKNFFLDNLEILLAHMTTVNIASVVLYKKRDDSYLG
jgi:hypothetical protein